MFGHGDLLNAFSLVDLLETSRRSRRTRARGTSTTSRSRTEDIDGVWVSAAANMRTYLLLKERAAAFRADPEVAEALAAAGVADLATPTLKPGETVRRPARRPLARSRTSTPTRPASAAAASSGCTSSPSSTCWVRR